MRVKPPSRCFWAIRLLSLFIMSELLLFEA
jgi:hypothetical protein